MDIRDISISDKPLFDKYYAESGREDSESCFTTLFLWKDYFKSQYVMTDGFLTVLAGCSAEKQFHTFPLGSGNVKPVLLKLRDYFMSGCGGYCIRGLIDLTRAQLEQAMPEAFDIKEKRAYGDYVYNTDELISLSGRRFHAKRNHFNTFAKSYNYSYHKIDDSSVDACANAVYDFVLSRNPEPDAEMKAMRNLFENYDKLGVTGAYLKADGRVIAVSVGEKHHGNALIHVEKANVDYKGVYPAINRLFLQNEFADCKFVNREEDMGSEGLRKAKLSYNPAFILKKYVALPKA